MIDVKIIIKATHDTTSVEINKTKYFYKLL